MTNILRFLEVFTLGTWLGGILYLSFVVAPAAFTSLGSPHQAGALVGIILTRLHIYGTVAGGVYLLATVAVERSIGALARPAALCVVLMLALTATSQWGVRPRMATSCVQMEAMGDPARENPLRVQFDRLHQWSVRLEGGVMLLGFVALFLTARKHS